MEDKPDYQPRMLDANEGLADGVAGKPYDIGDRSPSQRKAYIQFYQIGVKERELAKALSTGETRVLRKMGHGAGYDPKGPDEAIYQSLRRKELVEWTRGIPVTITDKGIRVQAILDEEEK